MMTYREIYANYFRWFVIVLRTKRCVYSLTKLTLPETHKKARQERLWQAQT